MAGDRVQHLLKRAFPLLQAGQMEAILLELMSLPIEGQAQSSFHETVDPAFALHHTEIEVERTSDWDAPIGRMLEASRDPQRRTAAIQRLELVWRAGLMTSAEERAFGQALWDQAFLQGSVPVTNFYLPMAFLSRPHPDDVDVSAAVANAVLTTEPLTDTSIQAETLAPLLATPEFPISETSVQQQLARLSAFVAAHPPRPDHPFHPFERGNSW